jgi:hypothetical protein
MAKDCYVSFNVEADRPKPDSALNDRESVAERCGEYIDEWSEDNK